MRKLIFGTSFMTAVCAAASISLYLTGHRITGTVAGGGALLLSLVTALTALSIQARARLPTPLDVVSPARATSALGEVRKPLLDLGDQWLESKTSMPGPAPRTATETEAIINPLSAKSAEKLTSGMSMATPNETGVWETLVEECVILFDSVESNRDIQTPPRELSDYFAGQLLEILHRCRVEIIDADLRFQRLRHQAQPPGTKAAEGDAIARTISPGFAVGQRVFRRARVELAKAGDSPGSHP